MNKYQKAIEVIDTLLHLMCGEEREDGYKPTMEEMSNSMNLLKDLANKADSKHEEITASEMFEAIGYHQVVISPKYCSYSFDDGGYIKSIEFIGIKKEIRLHDLETYNDNKSQDVFVLDEYELKAINKQCEELGWI